MKSIISNDKVCYVCGTTQDLHKHHIFSGSGRRQKSEDFGCWVYLCARHHNMSDQGVHFDRELDKRIRAECQAKLERQGWTREQFIRTFGRNYIDAD